MTSNPRVGVAAVIIDSNDRLLVGKRKGSHGSGESLPRGHFTEAHNEKPTFDA